MERQKAASPFHPSNEPFAQSQVFVLFALTQRDWSAPLHLKEKLNENFCTLTF